MLSVGSGIRQKFIPVAAEKHNSIGSDRGVRFRHFWPANAHNATNCATICDSIRKPQHCLSTCQTGEMRQSNNPVQSAMLPQSVRKPDKTACDTVGFSLNPFEAANHAIRTDFSVQFRSQCGI